MPLIRAATSISGRMGGLRTLFRTDVRVSPMNSAHPVYTRTENLSVFSSSLLVALVFLVAFSAIGEVRDSCAIISCVRATSEAQTSDDLTPVEPKKWRGRYVSPSERRATPSQRLRRRHERTPDPYAPGSNPDWARLEVIDSEGRPAFFDQNVMVASSTVRYADRDRLLGMDIMIVRKIHPQPLMLINKKAYAVTLKEGGWRRSVNVFVNVGTREYERDWFNAMPGQIVTISDNFGYPDGAYLSETLRVERATFGKVQTTVIGNDRELTHKVAYEGRLRLRETWPSFLYRQWQRVLENSFLIVATALVTGGVTISFSMIHTCLQRRNSVIRTANSRRKSRNRR